MAQRRINIRRAGLDETLSNLDIQVRTGKGTALSQSKLAMTYPLHNRIMWAKKAWNSALNYSPQISQPRRFCL